MIHMTFSHLIESICYVKKTVEFATISVLSESRIAADRDQKNKYRGLFNSFLDITLIKPGFWE